ncbi:MAG: hypothetical protein QOI82_2118 [Actinomycetota bacterium]|jgi:hypothetical protein|nr:hypothetical protein [Actinomycetota bacterium]
MDTLVIPVPRRRAYGLFALTAVLLVVSVLSDSAGRLLTAPAALVTLALALRDLTSGPVLRADAQGVAVLQGMRTITAGWDRVERIRVVKDRRTEMLELDLGTTLALLSRNRLGRLPEEVLTDLLAVRAASGARSRAEPPAPG